MNVVGRYTTRPAASRSRDWYSKVESPHPSGIDRDRWIDYHGDPLTYVVERIDPPDSEGMRYAVVGYSDRELVEMAYA